ncbi:MAG: threonine synthase [Sulfolobales archaeon]|nr:threonine synthase [Sulfolobales archaeon]MCX8199165.1 threonine synthase [Sulfolobales archaeon]MDW8170145.1 threonine synthase [Desulfurococcaceae archaeon]
MPYVKYLKCSKCGSKYHLSERPVMCSRKDLGRLDILYDYESISMALSKEDLFKRKFYVWRYFEFMPVSSEGSIVSLNEGGTPLIKAKRLAEALGLRNLYLKDETRNPTGSFKDRCMSVSVSMAIELGFEKAVIASSGNAAASLAAYGARAGLEVVAFVPHFTPLGKLAQLSLYGARVIRVKWVSSEDPTVLMMRTLAEEYGYYPSPSFGPFNPYQLEGSKTIAFEVAEQMNWGIPSQIFIPTGSASLLTGIYRGFRDLNRVGWINGYPMLVAVQSTGNAPFIRAWIEKQDPMNIRPWEKPPATIATGLEDTFPWDGDAGLRALYETNGYGLAVPDELIANAVKLLASYEGILAEPSGAAGLAGLMKAVEERIVDRDESIVVLVTGHGLKDPEFLLKIFPEPPLINPNIEEALAILKNYRCS